MLQAGDLPTRAPWASGGNKKGRLLPTRSGLGTPGDINIGFEHPAQVGAKVVVGEIEGTAPGGYRGIQGGWRLARGGRGSAGQGLQDCQHGYEPNL